MMTRVCAAAAVVILSAGVQPAAAQDVEAARPEAPLRAGPLQLFPTLTIREIGIDSNVYNESQVLREDFTYTVSPTLRAVLPIGESRLTTRGGLDFRYFQTLKDQQSTSGSLNVQLEIGSGRVRPFGTAGLVRSHERGGYDVDARALSMAVQAKVGASIALTPVTSLTGWLVREATSFSRDAQFDGVTLSEPLNRATRGTATGLRFDLTPFTSVTSAIEIEKIRFANQPLRDANSFRFAPVVQFTQGAIIEGQARRAFVTSGRSIRACALSRGSWRRSNRLHALERHPGRGAGHATTCSSPTTTRSRSIWKRGRHVSWWRSACGGRSRRSSSAAASAPLPEPRAAVVRRTSRAGDRGRRRHRRPR